MFAAQTIGRTNNAESRPSSVAPESQSVARPEISFTISMPRPETNLLEVEMRVRAERLPDQVDLVMPVWTPGSYLIREFERNVQDFAAHDAKGATLSWVKTNKNTWRVNPTGGREVVVTYRVYAKELGVRTSEVTDRHAFWNNANILMYLDGSLRAPASVKIKPYGDWNIYTTLPPVTGQSNTFRAANFDELYDSPFLVGKCQVVNFTVQNVPHRLVIDGDGNHDAERMRTGIQRLVEVEAAMMGGLPYRDYTFFVILRPMPGGGLEHLNSNVVIMPRFSFNTTAGYTTFFATIAHEYFHAWNVKRIKPEGFGPFDYTRENYTRMLWVAEGITDYYSELFLLRAGVISESEFLNRQAALIKNVQEKPGRFQTSLEEASFDAWIKYYRPDAYHDNRQISYYDKGALVGMMLDLEIRRVSDGRRSLDDVFRYLYKEMALKDHNCSAEDFQQVVETVAGAKLNDFFARYVRGKDEIDYNNFFAAVGLQLDMVGAVGAKTPPPSTAYLGLGVGQEGDRLMVRRVPAGTPGFDQGINTGDQIVAINGARVNETSYNDRLAEHKPGDIIRLTIFRDDDLRTFELKLGGKINTAYRILPLYQVTAVQQALKGAWLGK